MMTLRAIHGEWSLSFKNGLLHSEVKGITNSSASQAWFDEVKVLLKGHTAPWGAIIDCREWSLAALDAWEVNNNATEWFCANNCVIEAIVFSTKIHRFALENGFSEQSMASIVKLYSDYDEAYQACLTTLDKVQNLQAT